MNETQAGLEKEAGEFRQQYERLRKEVAKALVGQDEIVELVVIAILSGGHVLLEGVPGLGKTLLVRTLSECMHLQFSRIQFTPDLMPADILGTHVLRETADGKREFVFEQGPIFGNLILADEINRATPKTQSAMLQAMQESRVSIGRSHFVLDAPFFVLATQNPIEMEGTYPLPEAQLDRFLFKVRILPPGLEVLEKIFDLTTSSSAPKIDKVMDAADIRRMQALSLDVPIPEHLLRYVAMIIHATHPDAETAVEQVKQFVRFGSSPRGGQAIVLAAKVSALIEGRFNVSEEDIKKVAHPALRHRLILNFEAEAEGITTDEVITGLLNDIPSASGSAAKVLSIDKKD